MRWNKSRLLLVILLVAFLLYSSWRSHSLAHLVWARLNTRVSQGLLDAADVRIMSTQTAFLPGQPTDTKVKITVRERKGLAVERPRKVRLAISMHSVEADDLGQGRTAVKSESAGPQEGTEIGNVGQLVDESSTLMQLRAPVTDSLNSAASQQDRGSPQEAGATEKLSSGTATAHDGRPRRSHRPRPAQPLPVAPAGRSCESWLAEADARSYQRDFQRDPVRVLGTHDAELAGCAVPCKLESAAASAAMAAAGGRYDAHFGRSAELPGMGLAVLRSMESATNYPDLDVDRAHADGYDIVMTTRLDSDVPASYLSWAGALLYCRSDKCENVSRKRQSHALS